MKLPLSLIILAHQETATLQRVLYSAKWADEIVVIWLGKQKITGEWAQKAEIKIVALPPPITNFAQVRNEAMKEATHDWIFFLDSDEVLVKGEPEIEKIVHHDAPGLYCITRQDIFLGKKMRWGEVRQVRIPRLFKKSTVKYDRPVHEVVVSTQEMISTGITVEHFAHASVSSFLEKVIFYSQIEAELRLSFKYKVKWWQLILWPSGKLLLNYVVKLGFLDGWRGLIYALMMSIHSFSVRALMYEKQHTPK